MLAAHSKLRVPDLPTRPPRCRGLPPFGGPSAPALITPLCPSCRPSALPRLPQNASPDLYVAAVQGPNGAAPRPAGSKAEKCNRFVDGAMREMGDINICES